MGQQFLARPSLAGQQRREIAQNADSKNVSIHLNYRSARPHKSQTGHDPHQFPFLRFLLSFRPQQLGKQTRKFVLETALAAVHQMRSTGQKEKTTSAHIPTVNAIAEDERIESFSFEFLNRHQQRRGRQRRTFQLHQNNPGTALSDLSFPWALDPHGPGSTARHNPLNAIPMQGQTIQHQKVFGQSRIRFLDEPAAHRTSPLFMPAPAEIASFSLAKINVKMKLSNPTNPGAS